MLVPTVNTTLASPVPERAMVCVGDPLLLSVIVIRPLREPDAVGVNVTVIVQLELTGIPAPQLLVCEKSPVATIEEIKQRGATGRQVK